MSENNEQVEKLLGDFFERHTAGDKEGMNEVLQKIQLMLYSGETDSTPFKDYFNNMYTGRSAINVSGMVSDYPREPSYASCFRTYSGATTTRAISR